MHSVWQHNKVLAWVAAAAFNQALLLLHAAWWTNITIRPARSRNLHYIHSCMHWHIAPYRPLDGRPPLRLGSTVLPSDGALIVVHTCIKTKVNRDKSIEMKLNQKDTVWRDWSHRKQRPLLPTSKTTARRKIEVSPEDKHLRRRNATSEENMPESGVWYVHCTIHAYNCIQQSRLLLLKVVLKAAVMNACKPPDCKSISLPTWCWAAIFFRIYTCVYN